MNDFRANANEAIVLAAEMGHVNVLQFLHDIVGMNIGDFRAQDNEAIVAATRRNNINVLQFLLNTIKLTRDDFSTRNGTVLLIAMENNDIELLRFFIDNGVHMGTGWPETVTWSVRELCEQMAQDGNVEALHNFCKGDQSYFMFCLRKCWSSGTEDTILKTLMYLQKWFNLGQIREWLDNNQENSICKHAMRRGFLRVIKFLFYNLEFHAGYFCRRDRLSILRDLIEGGNIECLKFLWNVVYVSFGMSELRSDELKRCHKEGCRDKKCVLLYNEFSHFLIHVAQFHIIGYVGPRFVHY